MKNLTKKIILIFIIFFLFNPLIVKADLYDEEGILSIEQTKNIEDMIEKHEDENKYNVIIRIYKKSGDIELQTVNWYDINYNTLEYKDSVMFSINLETRETFIETFDKLSSIKFNDNSKILIKSKPFLTMEDYEGFTKCFLENLKSEILKQKTIKITVTILLNLIVFNALTFFVAKGFGNKKTTTPKTYISNKSIIRNRNDIYIRTDVIKTKKASSNSSTSSGHSRGGGGRGSF